MVIGPKGFPAPENVRLVHPDGTEIPLQCRYDGQDSDGIYQWVAVAPVGVVIRPGMSMKMATLPAKTSVSVDFDPRL